MKKSAGVLIAAVLLLLCPSLFAQDGRFDVSVNVAGELPRQTDGNGVTQIPTNSVGFLATGRYRLSSLFSLEAAWERSHDSQKYQTGGLFYQVFTGVNEFSGSLVAHPWQHGHWEPFLLGGGGMLSFGPTASTIDGTTTAIGAVRQLQPAFVYGVGTDYRLASNFALRLQYRGLFYKPPDFKVLNLFTGGTGHIAEPAIGLAFNF